MQRILAEDELKTKRIRLIFQYFACPLVISRVAFFVPPPQGEGRASVDTPSLCVLYFRKDCVSLGIYADCAGRGLCFLFLGG